MANIKSAKKRIRVLEKKTQRNRRVKSHLKEILKDFEAALAAGEQKTARDKLALAEKKLMQAVSKGTLHKNTASRKVSRITKAFIKAFGKDALLEKADLPGVPDKSEKEAKKEAKGTKKAAAKQADEPEAEEEASAAEEDKPAKKSTKKASVEEAEEAEAPVEAEETPAGEVAEAPVEEAEAPVEAAEEPEAPAETAEAPAPEAEETVAEEAAAEEDPSNE